MKKILKSIVVLSLIVTNGFAELKEITVSKQYGLSYLSLIVVEEK